MIFTTNLTKKAERYLQSPIDTETFYVLEVSVQNDKKAAVLLAPIKHTDNSYFNLKYGNKSQWFGSLEQMLNCCVEQGYIKQSAVKALIEKYNSQQNKRRMEGK